MVVSNFSFLSNDEKRTSLDFRFVSISEEDSKKIIFEQNLQLLDEDDNVVDTVTVAVEKGVRNGENFKIYQYSHQDKMLVLKTKSTVSRALETLSEVRKIKNNETEKLIRVTNFPSEYRVFYVVTDLELRTGQRLKTEVQKSKMKPLVLEGANVLLQRKVAISRLLGQFTATSVNNSGIICEVEYTVEELSPNKVKMTRTLGSEIMTTILACDGRILEHRWSSSPLRLESGLEKLEADDGTVGAVPEGGEEETEVESEPLVDMEAYWEKKEEIHAKLKEYMAHHSDVEDMIADFMKNLLFEKPDDAIDFADKFFSEFLGIVRESEPEIEVKEKEETRYDTGGRSSKTSE